MPVRFGLLSTARVNRHLLAAARASDRVEIVAVASRDGGRAEAYAAEHGLPRAHGSYESLLADPQVDAVYVSLPNSLHVKWTLRALEAGKHVLVEKPLSRRAAEVEAAFDAAEAADLLVSEAFMWRHHPQTRTLARLVAEGAVGRLRLVRAAFSFALPPDAANVRLRPELEGGALMDVGCYCVNAARLLAGEPEHVAGVQVVGPTGVDTVFAGVLRLPDDVLAHFDCALVVPYHARLDVLGEEGALVVRDPWHARSPGIEHRRPDGRTSRVVIPDADSYRLELENVADAIRGDAPLLLGREDAVGQARALEALHEAATIAAAVPA